MNIALLTAAGRGTRMNMDTPKQFIMVNDKPILAYTMQVFENHHEIDAILVVTLEMWKNKIEEMAKKSNITKLKWIAIGGDTGQESIYNGLKLLEKNCSKTDTVIIHDGNRPFISKDIITDSLKVYRKYGGAVAAMPCIEAIFRSSDGIQSRDDIPREELFRTQTPHTYSLGKLLWAHEEAGKRQIKNTTATCVLMRMLGETVFFSKGSDKNIKITVQDDLDIFSALLKAGR